MKISDNKHITLTYDLTVGEEKELMESATTEQPLEFIFGTNSMLEAFESNLNGLSKDDLFSFVLSPEEAYGEYDDERVVELPKDIFKVEGKIDEDILVEGNTVPMMDASGNRLMGSVVTVDDEVVTMDFNHPLAGETLHFDGKVIGVRDASPEEIAALFSGGDCGCSSGGCGCDDVDAQGGCASGSCGSGCGC